ncbi:MAG: hypothetical protein COU90_04220 [Candidatus Ryanbacteria bacterium CG10_big_fil_rev_8_21_14_0_10_43_42]|uniref:Uncharacterized protein n=1 Tax=Candidatus Ryanbacteria bacterium CG10_big_fil_rev_8_21_14_0_10_43_42 TaxID=1974864 RepID=A0A2M8KVX3_9BACT|nr:MAG: hypothetical protein COU90_04220 [Candidatus Ryanbacteria bacterium CG10_big_fil_rev_8_21_14_0_10_43_42]
MQQVSYLFNPGRRSILVEVYFPRRIRTQGTIFKALNDGLHADNVRKYLTANVENLMREIVAYPHWFNPNRYDADESYVDATDAARARMNMYQTVFYGWSEYAVDGVFLKVDGVSIDEERTQTLKLIFAFENEELQEQATNAGYFDVYLAVLNWVLSQYGQAEDHRNWSNEERDLFLLRHALWPEEKRSWARDNFVPTARSIGKWIDDCGLFIFGYLVRRFWEEIVRIHQEESGSLEDTIWVTSIFHVDVNELKPVI